MQPTKEVRNEAATRARAVGAFAIAEQIELGNLGPEAVPNEVVVQAIRDKFRTGEELLATLRYHGPLDTYWSFMLCGMFVGVEQDGHIHS